MKKLTCTYGKTEKRCCPLSEANAMKCSWQGFSKPAGGVRVDSQSALVRITNWSSRPVAIASYSADAGPFVIRSLPGRPRRDEDEDGDKYLARINKNNTEFFCLNVQNHKLDDPVLRIWTADTSSSSGFNSTNVLTAIRGSVFIKVKLAVFDKDPTLEYEIGGDGKRALDFEYIGIAGSNDENNVIYAMTLRDSLYTSTSILDQEDNRAAEEATYKEEEDEGEEDDDEGEEDDDEGDGARDAVLTVADISRFIYKELSETKNPGELLAGCKVQFNTMAGDPIGCRIEQSSQGKKEFKGFYDTAMAPSQSLRGFSSSADSQCTLTLARLPSAPTDIANMTMTTDGDGVVKLTFAIVPNDGFTFTAFTAPIEPMFYSSSSAPTLLTTIVPYMNTEIDIVDYAETFSKKNVFPESKFPFTLGSSILRYGDQGNPTMNGIMQGVRLVFTEIGQALRERLFKAHPEFNMRACMYDSGKYNGLTDETNRSLFGLYTNQIRGNCDKFMRDVWCAKPSDDGEEAEDAMEKRKVECACFPAAPIGTGLDAEVYLEAQKKKSLGLPKECIISACTAGTAYRTQTMNGSTCPQMCIQIQQAINEGGSFGDIVFDGTQTMKCGGEELSNKPTDDPEEDPTQEKPALSASIYQDDISKLYLYVDPVSKTLSLIDSKSKATAFVIDPVRRTMTSSDKSWCVTPPNDAKEEDAVNVSPLGQCKGGSFNFLDSFLFVSLSDRGDDVNVYISAVENEVDKSRKIKYTSSDTKTKWNKEDAIAPTDTLREVAKFTLSISGGSLIIAGIMSFVLGKINSVVLVVLLGLGVIISLAGAYLWLI